MGFVQTAFIASRSGVDYYWMVTAAAMAHPTTRKTGFKMASYGLRATGSATLAAARTPFVAGGSFSLASLAGSVAAGYAIGATVGTGIAYAGWGESGARTAVDVYTSPDLMAEAVLSIPENAWSIAEHYMQESVDDPDNELNNSLDPVIDWFRSIF